MIFLPHTNTVILLEPYCGTITEPGLPVVESRDAHRLPANDLPQTWQMKLTQSYTQKFRSIFV